VHLYEGSEPAFAGRKKERRGNDPKIIHLDMLAC